MARLTIVWPLAWLLASTAFRCLAQDTLRTKEYNSPSGAFTIRCEPTDSEGIGASTVSCTRDGHRLWESVLDFSLWDAAVTDDGIVAGYAYEYGHQGDPREPGVEESLLWIVILDDAGQVRAQHARERARPRRVETNPPSPHEPLVRGMTLMPEQDLLIVRVAQGWDSPRPPWWTYRLSTGEPIADLVPDQPEDARYGLHKETFADLIPGTPLVLVHWYIFVAEDERTVHSAELSVLTRDGKEIWARAFPEEYGALGERWSWWRDLVGKGVVQAGVGDHAFSFCSYSLGERLRFSCTPGDDGDWLITELGGEPCTPTSTPQEPPR